MNNATAGTVTAIPPTASASKYSPADLFRRGIKLDQSLFPTLKDERYNDTWHRTFLNQARAQGVTEVLDPNYKPTTDEEKALFAEKKKFVYAILESKVLTDRGKAIVRDHEKDFDAQAVYKKLQEHHLKSTKAKMDSSTILSYITSARLGTGEWRGSAEGFIMHWLNQVCLYERQSSKTFDDDMKRTMLENAVNEVDALHQVKTNADIEKSKNGEDLKFDAYLSILLSAAASYDDKYNGKQCTKRAVYLHDWTGSHISDGGDGEGAYDIDVPVSIIHAHATERRLPGGNRVRMPRERWMKLGDNARGIWDTLSDKDKATILGLGQSPGRISSDSSKQVINLHDISAYDYLQAHYHENVTFDAQEGDEDFQDAAEHIDESDDTSPDDPTLLINAAKSKAAGSKLSPGDIRRIMSQNSKSSKGTVSANLHLTYCVSAHHTHDAQSLVDRGANGGVAGVDVRVITKTHRKVHIQGIDNHQVSDIDIGTVGGVITTQNGPVIAILHQYALLGKGTSIHSPGQLEHYKSMVDDKSIHVGGKQCIKTLDGYMIPLEVKNGLPRLRICPYTDTEWESLPHIILTSELEWDPSVLDHAHNQDDHWYDAVSELDAKPHANLFNEFGEYKHRVSVHWAEYLTQTGESGMDALIDQCVYHAHSTTHCDVPNVCDDTGLYFLDVYTSQLGTSADPPGEPSLQSGHSPRQVSTQDPDYGSLRPFFGWFGIERICKTLENTTQYARIPVGTTLKRAYKSPNPALNVLRHPEPVATDIVYSDTPAVDDGSTAATVFVGTRSAVTDVYGIKTDKQFINTLEDNIIARGAPNKLISDRAQVEISTKVQDILRTLFISSWQSEPHQQHQNFAERRIQTLKTSTNRIMDRTGAPASTWLLCLAYVCFLLNHMWDDSIHGVPLTVLTGVTVDISVLLRFYFWQKVYYKKVDSGFPSESTEGLGHIVGISEHVGHALTWKILTSDTHKVIYRSQVRPVDATDANNRAKLLGGEEDPTKNPSQFVRLRSDFSVDGSNQADTVVFDQKDDALKESKPPDPPLFDPEELVGQSFLLDEQEDGQKFRARIVKMIDDHESDLHDNPTRKKFICSVNGDKAEEVIMYNQLLDYLTKDEDNQVVWKFKCIVSHQGPLSAGHPDYNNSSYNIMIEWENGEITSEPLSVIAKDDPVTCAIYAKENGLLDTPGWKRFKGIAKRDKKFIRIVNQAKLRSF